MSIPRLVVLLISPMPPPPGGIATWSVLLRREILRHEHVKLHHVDTAVRWRPVTQLNPALRLVGGALQAARDFAHYALSLKRTRPHVVHLCTSAGPALRRDLVLLRFARRHGVPALIHYRMGRIPALAEQKNGEWALLVRCSQTAALSLVLDARSERALRAALPDATVRTMPNMIDVAEVDAVLATEQVPPDTGFSVCFVGHVLPSKGVSDLVRASLQIDRPLTLEIVGPYEQPYRDELTAMVAGAPTNAQHSVRLRFHGTLSRSEALKMMRRCSVFSLPSHTEGFPNVVAEAMACGRPVLGTTVGAMPDMLQVDTDAPCGLCVPPRDPEALPRGLTSLADDGALREAMGRRGRQRAETEYAAPVVTERLVRLWQELAAGGVS